MNYLGYLKWDPNPVCFHLPFFNHPIAWYGVLFALGFLVSYTVLKRILHFEVAGLIDIDRSQINHVMALRKILKVNSDHESEIVEKLREKLKTKTLSFTLLKPYFLRFSSLAHEICDRMTFTLVLAIVLGARLGYVFFYGWPIYRENPVEIFKTWNGGLASHGACLGILMGLFLLKKKFKKMPFSLGYLFMIDVLAICSGFFAFFIRLGNFMNQEILGRITTVPWSIMFLSPLDGSSIQPRHPVQLYEAFFYLALAFVIYTLWKSNVLKVGSGKVSAVFLTLLFSYRFFIEFLKEPQGEVMPLFKGLSMGQYLSLPFIALGLALWFIPSLLEKRQCKPSQL